MSARLEPRLFEVVAIHYETAREISRVLFPVSSRGQKGLQDALWAARADAAGKSRVCGMAYVVSQVQRKWHGMAPGRMVIFRFGQEVTAEAEKQLWLPLGVVCEASGIALHLRMESYGRSPDQRAGLNSKDAKAQSATHGHQGGGCGVTIREAMVTLVDTTADLLGADEVGEPLHTARCIVRERADRIGARAQERLKREKRRREVLANARNAKRDPQWDEWDRQFSKAIWDRERLMFVNTTGQPLSYTKDVLPREAVA